jgi:two-component system OmpR family response regulator
MERILIVEDERKLNDVVRDYLESLGFQTKQCYNGLDAVRWSLSEKPDLVVLDLMLPGLDGTEAARRIRKESAVPIIMLTARDAEADKLLGLEVGADDYITKPFSVRELGARVRAVLRRCGNAEQDKGACEEPVRHAGIEMDVPKRRVTKDGRPVELTPAQFDILLLLLRQPGRVFKRCEIIEKTSGYAYEGYERTVDVHVKNIRKAIEDDPSDPKILLTVWGVGYTVQE